MSDVNVILTGIGAMGGGHRLRLARGQNSELADVQQSLDRLNQMVDALDPGGEVPPFYHWVGDVCNSYFVVDDAILDSLRLKLKAPQRKRIEQELANLNRRFVNTDSQTLSRCCARGATLAVTGGPHKVAAITHVLRQDPPWISHLVTDLKTAREVLKLLP